MGDTIKVLSATIALLTLAACCFIGFYLVIEWVARTLARTGWI